MGSKFFEPERIGRATAFAFAAAMICTLLLLFGLQAAIKPAHAATIFTVNSTGDEADADLTDTVCDVDTGAGGDQCTLRAAIQEANTTTDADTITFNIGGGTTGVKTINVGTSTTASGQSLPDIIQPVTIDGYTQSEATENDILMARDGTNAKLLIELNGANAGGNGLAINASNVVVKGLAINRFGGSGIFIFFDGSGAEIEGNFIGTDPSGTQSLVGNNTGVTAFGGGANIIGGREAAPHNLISGNRRGLSIASNTGNTIVLLATQETLYRATL
jgi:CSLREA domain-containing protein